MSNVICVDDWRLSQSRRMSRSGGNGNQKQQSLMNWRAPNDLPKHFKLTSTTQDEISNMKLTSLHVARVVCVSAITFLYDYLCLIKIQLAYEAMVFSFMVMMRMMLSSACHRVLDWQMFDLRMRSKVKLLSHNWRTSHWELTFHQSDNRWNIKKWILLHLPQFMSSTLIPFSSLLKREVS